MITHPDIIKISGDYGIKKPIYISTVVALKWVRGQRLFEELNPGMYHRSTARSWLWKNRASKYIEDAKLECPVVYMGNNIHSYENLEREIQHGVERWINKHSEHRFNERHNTGMEESELGIIANDRFPAVALQLTRHEFRNFTKASVLSLQHKLNEVCRQHALTEKHEKYPRDRWGRDSRGPSSTRLFNKWYGADNGTRLSRFG